MLTGSNYPAINGSDVRALRIPTPSDYSEQVAIAKIFTAASTEINQMENLCGLMKIQKKALMQKLLTGKIRVRA